MFLSILNSTEREDFMNLLINTASIDGDFTENEKRQISAYATEMGISLKNHADYKESNDVLIEKFKGSSEEVKKSIFMETTALMLADGMHKKEEELLNLIQNAFDFPSSYKAEIISWFQEIFPLYKKGFELAGLTGAAK